MGWLPPNAVRASADWIVAAFARSASELGAPLAPAELEWILLDATAGDPTPPAPPASRLVPIGRHALRADLTSPADSVLTQYGGRVPSAWLHHVDAVVESGSYPNLTKLLVRAISRPSKDR